MYERDFLATVSLFPYHKALFILYDEFIMSGANNNVILRFDNVSFHYGEDNKKKVILDEADFSIRENTKITIMGQNGA